MSRGGVALWTGVEMDLRSSRSVGGEAEAGVAGAWRRMAIYGPRGLGIMCAMCAVWASAGPGASVCMCVECTRGLGITCAMCAVWASARPGASVVMCVECTRGLGILWLYRWDNDVQLTSNFFIFTLISTGGSHPDQVCGFLASQCLCSIAVAKHKLEVALYR